MKTNTTTYSLMAILLACILAGCGNPVPNDYEPELVIEGFVIAGQPIERLRVFQSQPLNIEFNLATATVRDAEVTLLENGTPIPLQFVADSTGGNYLPVDTAFRAKYDATYALTVTAIGRTATATARTLKPFSWTRPPVDTLRYPGQENELQPVDSLGIAWEGQAGVGRYVLAIMCLDTTNYGSYLTPQTDELNSRIREEEYDDGTMISDEPARYGFSQVSNTPVVWAAFKWYGKQQIKVYCGDDAFQEWFNSVGFGRRSQYDYRLSNVNGGLGVFAGASMIDAPIFLLKQK